MHAMLCFALMFVAGAAPAAAETLRDKYVAAWAGRLDGYRGEFVRQDAALRREIAQGAEQIFASESTEWKELVGPVMGCAFKIREKLHDRRARRDDQALHRAYAGQSH